MMLLGGVQQRSNHHFHHHRRREGKKVVTKTTRLETTTTTKDDDVLRLFSSNTNTTTTTRAYENEREEEETSAPNNNVVDAFLVTGYGRDRPGIYAQFSRAASAIRADIEAARLAKLGSDFTITALVSVAKKHNNNNNNNNNKTKKALQDALDAHIDRFTCDVREVPPETRRNEAHARSRGYKKLIIRATNFPGITSRVTETLAKCGLNIEALRMDTKMSPFNNNTTTTSSTRNGDDEMYFCEATVRLIDGAFREDTFKKEVEKLEDELSCDVDVEDVSDVE